MIHVDPQPEPKRFNTLVRHPGHKYLANNPTPSSKEWEQHSYWRKILPDMHFSYRGICAYSCHWIPYDTGADTVEHFLPKNEHPQQAYEWSNYRLVCATLNSRKRRREDILDPFHVKNGWFTIDFPSLLVKPAKALNKNLTQRIQLTIDILKLNDEGTCWQSRERYIKAYCLGQITFDYLLSDAPFIASELMRQNLVESIREIMDYSSL